MKDSTITVAYADDHTLVRKGIISFVKENGGIDFVIQASNGRDLIKQLEAAEYLPDVVMLDINMPEMDGFATITALKAKWPDIKVLVLTIYSLEFYIIRMIKIGANGYLLKSCDSQEINDALKIICDVGFYYSNVATSHFFRKVKNGHVALPKFSEKEIYFLKYCPSDLSYSEIAKKMNTTTKAIEGYRDRLCDKLQVNSRIGLAMYAIQFGIFQIEAKSNPDSFIMTNKTIDVV